MLSFFSFAHLDEIGSALERPVVPACVSRPNKIHKAVRAHRPKPAASPSDKSREGVAKEVSLPNSNLSRRKQTTLPKRFARLYPSAGGDKIAFPKNFWSSNLSFERS